MAIRISNTNTRMNYRDCDVKQECGMTAQEVERLAGVTAGDAIVSTRGVLWVTQEGDPEDYMLRKGERFVANKRGSVVVQALTDAAYRVSEN